MGVWEPGHRFETLYPKVKRKKDERYGRSWREEGMYPPDDIDLALGYGYRLTLKERIAALEEARLQAIAEEGWREWFAPQEAVEDARYRASAGRSTVDEGPKPSSGDTPRLPGPGDEPLP